MCSLNLPHPLPAMRSLSLTLLFLSVVPAASAQEPIRLGDEVERSLAAGDAHAYPLDLDADQFVLGTVDQQTLDVVVTITGPDGQTVRSFDDTGRGPEPFQFTTDTAGTYTLTVTPFEQEEGRYVIRLARSEPVATTPGGTVDQLFVALDDDRSPGAVVAVLEHGEVVFANAYGMADLTHGVPFTTETPSNIASTSKQFTAFAVALLAQRGELALDDDVRTYVPELPDFGETVTLRHLLTHTSGYRDYFTTLAMAGLEVNEDHIDRDDVLGVVERQPELQNAPGAEFNYNNTGYGILALVVERVTETPFQDWMRDTVFRPLGMDHSVVRADNVEIVPGRAMGYVAGEAGRWQEAVDGGGGMGAGSIYTTAGDLLRWMDNYRTATLGGPDVIREMTTRGVLTTGDTLDYGLGLFVGEHRGLRKIEHSGSDGGRRADFVYYPEIESGVVVLTNSPTVPASAERVAEVFFADAFAEADESAPQVPPRPDYDSATFVPEAFDAFAGRYELDDTPGYVLTFSRDGDRYSIQILERPKAEIVPIGPARFAARSGRLDVSFHAAPDGSVGTMTVHQNGGIPATRIPEESEPVSLDEYVGHYYSDELETGYSVEIIDGDLVLVHPRIDEPILLHQGRRDRYRGRSQISDLEFERGADGAVTGFRAGGNDRTRGVHFERMR